MGRRSHGPPNLKWSPEPNDVDNTATYFEIWALRSQYSYNDYPPFKIIVYFKKKDMSDIDIYIFVAMIYGDTYHLVGRDLVSVEI